MGAEQAPEPPPPPPPPVAAAERGMGFAERAVAAAGAAVVSAVLVNPLDVAKTRLQAQAAGVVYNPEGVFRLWRGTAASLALAVPTVGIYLPSYDLLRNWIEEYSDHSFPKLRPYAPLIAGSVARSLACITCSPIELARTRMQFGHTTFYGLVLEHNLHVTSPSQLYAGQFLNQRHLIRIVGEQSNAAVILGANFSAGFIAGVISAGATCPLDKDPARVLHMNTRRILHEVWSKEGISGIFRGAGPRMARAGPSVGIVVSSYEVVKHIMHRKHAEL
uniref:Mitochondrial carrier protein n=1 Tax=Oryza glumipatula TaxID=40148 RepID=A0A0D9Y5F4_9ORYZ